jgi:hypothetical protein
MESRCAPCVARWIGEALRYRPASDAPREAKLRIMSRGVVFGAVAGRLAAASGDRADGTRSQIPQAQELFQELGLWVAKVARSSGYGLLSVAHSIRTYKSVQNNALKKTPWMPLPGHAPTKSAALT